MDIDSKKFHPFLKENIYIFFGLIVVIAILFYQAQIPLWKNHLQVDVVTFFNRAKYFFTSCSWTGLQINEYQPGALLFFLVPLLIVGSKASYLAYLNVFIFLDIV